MYQYQIIPAEKAIKILRKTIAQLLDYCNKTNWGGYDPFDGLNSKIIRFLPFLDNRAGRLIIIQGMKRSPVNLRPLFLVPREQNPKGIALFISALVRLAKLHLDDDKKILKNLIEALVALKSPDKQYFCWGYNFKWQSRYFLSPKYEPYIISTSFAGNALLEAFDFYGDQYYLDMALSAGNFILNRLNIINNGHEICFSYTEQDNSQVHNANLVGASFLARLYCTTRQENLLHYSLSAARFSANRQNKDGSWFYGEEVSQKWIDNFHTGYNLCALLSINKYTGSSEFESHLRHGFQFYSSHFFREDGRPKYRHNRTYPIDIHCVAQSIITLVTLKQLCDDSINQALTVFSWTMAHMHDKQGYFYYQVFPCYKNKISYIRWSQAWMLLALVTLLEEISTTLDNLSHV